jgi:hypothetical protein
MCRPTSGEEEGACGNREDGEAIHELAAVAVEVVVAAWLVAGTLGLGLVVWMGVLIVGVIVGGSSGEGDTQSDPICPSCISSPPSYQWRT